MANPYLPPPPQADLVAGTPTVTPLPDPTMTVGPATVAPLPPMGATVGPATVGPAPEPGPIVIPSMEGKKDPNLPSFNALVEGPGPKAPAAPPATIDTPFIVNGQPLQAPNPAAPPAPGAASPPPPEGTPSPVIQSQGVTEVIPKAPAAPAGPSELAKLYQAQKAAQAAQDAFAAEAQSAKSLSTAMQVGQQAADIEKAERDRQDFADNYKIAQDRYKTLSDRSAQLAEQLANTKIDPDRYFKDRSAAAGFGSAMSIVMYSALQGAGMSKDNPGLDMLQKSIDRDIDAQKTDLETKIKSMGQFGQLARDTMANQAEMRMYEHTMRESHWQLAEQRLKEMAARMGIPEDNAKFMGTMAAIQEKRINEDINRKKAAIAASLAEARYQQERRDKIRFKALDTAAALAGHVPEGTDITSLLTTALAGGSGLQPEGGMPHVVTGVKPTPEAVKAKDEKESAKRAYQTVMPMYDQWVENSQHFTSKIPLTDRSRFMDAAERQVRIAIAPSIARLGLGSEAEGALIADMIPRWQDSQATLANKRAIFEMYAGKPLSDAEVAEARKKYQGGK